MSRSIRSARPEALPLPPAPLAHERVVTVFAVLAFLVGMLVPVSAFAAVRSWSLTRTPATVTGGAPASVQVTATNTGDDGGGEAVGCVVIAIPTSDFTVTNVAVDSVSDGDHWSASLSGDATWWYATIVSDSGGQNRLHQFESVVATITFNDTGVDGTFGWTGNAFNKEDCTDDFGMPRSVSVTIDGAVVNNPPVAQVDAYTTGRNAPLAVGAPGVLSNDTDPDGDPLTATLTAGPSNGGLVLGGDGSFAYTPDPGFVGTDGFTYHADDPTTSSADVIVTITVVNTAPVAGDDGPYPVVEDTTLSIAAPGVLANDTDDDGDALSATLVADATNGTVTLQPDGSFDYVADPDFAGTDSFTYRTSDGLTSSLDATVSIAVTGSDDPPAASAESYATPEDTTLHVPAPGVLANDTELDGDPISATLVTPPVNGVLTLDPSGALTYAPGPDFHGADSFTYAVSDGTGSDTATVTLTISPVNDAPLAAPDSMATAHGTSTLIDVLANDADVDGDAIAIASVGTPSAGTAMVESGRIRYTPPAAFSGAATFSYTISDGTTTDTATVTITVAPVPTPVPTASPIPTPTPPAPVSPPASSAPTPVTTPTPTPDPPAAQPSPSASPEPEISASPTATPEPEDGSPPPSPQPTLPPAPPSPSTGSGTGMFEPLSVPQVTTGGFGSDGGSFEFAGLFDGFGGSFAWAMPAAILGVPGLLFMLAVAGQLLGAAAWVPTIRRMLAGIGVRRRRSA